MKIFQFEREAKYIQLGTVMAEDKDEAIQMIKDGDYDDIFDTCLEEEYNDSIKITAEEECNDEEDEEDE